MHSEKYNFYNNIIAFRFRTQEIAKDWPCYEHFIEEETR